MPNITQNFHHSNIIVIITIYLILTSLSLTRILYATCTSQLKLRLCTTNSYKVIIHHYICNKFTVNETSSQTAQSLNSASISPQPENMKLGGSELNSSVRRERRYRNDVFVRIERNMPFFKYQTSLDNKRYIDFTINDQLKQSLSSVKGLILMANDSVTPIFELYSTEFMIYPIFFF